MKKGILWLSLATLFFVVALFFWFGRGTNPNKQANVPVKGTEPVATQSAPSGSPANFPLLSQFGSLNGAAAGMASAHHSQTNNRFAHRLSNTTLSVGQLARKEN